MDRVHTARCGRKGTAWGAACARGSKNMRRLFTSHLGKPRSIETWKQDQKITHSLYIGPTAQRVHHFFSQCHLGSNIQTQESTRPYSYSNDNRAKLSETKPVSGELTSQTALRLLTQLETRWSWQQRVNHLEIQTLK